MHSHPHIPLMHSYTLTCTHAHIHTLHSQALTPTHYTHMHSDMFPLHSHAFIHAHITLTHSYMLTLHTHTHSYMIILHSHMLTLTHYIHTHKLTRAHVSGSPSEGRRKEHVGSNAQKGKPLKILLWESDSSLETGMARGADPGDGLRVKEEEAGIRSGKLEDFAFSLLPLSFMS